jgi:WD40 repeat protein
MQAKSIIVILSLVVISFCDIYAPTYPFSTIDTPGFYQLAGTVSNEIAITASDVTLDMNGQTVGGGTNGISISSGLSNITIKNGTISGVTSAGILVNSGCSDITLDNIAATNAIVGISFSNATNSLIRNCDMISNTTGVLITSSKNLVFQDCVAQANRNAGYDLVSSVTCSFFDCKALSIGQGNTSLFGNAANVFGFVSVNGVGNIFEGCVANSSLNLTATGVSVIIAGFGLRGSESCSKIIGCEVSNAGSSSNGVTMPYGIWLESTLDNLTTITQVFAGSTSSQVGSLSWSPDGLYLAANTTVQSGTTRNVGLFEYQRPSNQLILYQLIAAGITVNETGGMAWSPSGDYLATGDNGNNINIYQFDSAAKRLQRIISLATASAVGDVSWSLNQQYIATAQSDIAASARIFKFDALAETIITATNLTYAVATESIAWSPVDTYLLAIGDDNGLLRIYRFAPPNTALQLAVLQLGNAGNDINQVEWSYDGKYIAASQDTSGFHIVRYQNNTLTRVAGVTSTLAQAAHWSADNKYIAMGAISTNTLGLYSFDYASETLTQLRTVNFGNVIRELAWSPDGAAIAVCGTGTSTAQQIALYTALNFPSNNIIMNNKIYCNNGGSLPWGVGICGSSIVNTIVGNSCFNNAFNYQFVCNGFNNLFGQGPTLLQNEEVVAKVPLTTPFDIPSQIRRTELLLFSLVDNLL